jgi:hypothetical protein
MVGYHDEHWLDVRSDLVVNLMKKRLDAAAAVGCDAIDGDNIDGYVRN